MNTLRIDLCVRCGSRVRLSAIAHHFHGRDGRVAGFGRALWFGKPKRGLSSKVVIFTTPLKSTRSGFSLAFKNHTTVSEPFCLE